SLHDALPISERLRIPGASSRLGLADEREVSGITSEEPCAAKPADLSPQRREAQHRKCRGKGKDHVEPRKARIGRDGRNQRRDAKDAEDVEDVRAEDITHG